MGRKATMAEMERFGLRSSAQYNIDRWVYEGRPSFLKANCSCNTVMEKRARKSDLDAWLNKCTQCRAQHRATAGRRYSASAGGFISSSMTASDAVVLRNAPEARQITTTQATPSEAKPQINAQPALGLPSQLQTPERQAGANMATRNFAVSTSMNSASLGSVLGGGIGTVIGGPLGGVLGGSLGGLVGGGSSKCPGPFNYNPVTGGCDPKPGTGLVDTGTGGYGCPSGTEWDQSTRSCKKTGIVGTIERTLPGGDTGYYSPTPTGSPWQSTAAYGTQGVVPQSEASTRLVCPRGYVLYGKQPGQEVCLPKGMLPNKLRKWPKSPNPALSSQDMKTLRRIGSLQKKIKRVAGVAGFTTRKR